MTRRAMVTRLPLAAGVLAAAGLLAACSGGLSSLGSFGSKPAPATVVNPDPYPANYRQQVASVLIMNLTDRADFRGAQIAAPALKPVANGQSPHYVVCVLLTGGNVRRAKAVVYLEGRPNAFVDATPEQCGDAAYQPYTELIYEQPERNDRRQVGSGDPSHRDVP
jgi:hypothetical protein